MAAFRTAARARRIPSGGKLTNKIPMSQKITPPLQKTSLGDAAKVYVLALNAGSSSLKFALFDAHAPSTQIVFGAINGIG